MMTATREMFLKPAARRYDRFSVPGFGDVRIQSLTDGEKSDYEYELIAKKGGFVPSKLRNAARRLIVLTVVDDTGNRVLRDGDETKLEEMDGAITQAIYDRARTHCGFNEGDIEEAVKNSEQIPVAEPESA